MSIRLGIIGAGLIWNEHKPALLEMKDRVQIAAFSVRSDTNREKLAEEFPGLPCYKEYREMLQSSDIDAVVILTPLSLNGPITLEALQAGKHVFVEKPMTVSNQEAKQIIKLEASRGLKVFVLEQFRYKDSIQELKKVLESGRIGKVVSYDRVVHFVFKQDDNPDSYGSTEWRIKPEFPLGAIFDGGIHNISELTDLFGTPEAVYARGNNFREEFGEQDQIVMMLNYPSGVIGTFSHSSFLPSSQSYFHIRGTEGTIKFTDRFIAVQTKELEEIKLERNDAGAEMWDRCIKILEGKPSEIYGSKEALQDISILNAVDQSIKTGQVAKV